MEKSRPNILVITTDQHRWDGFSLWGTPGYTTPNIDRIGTNGANFVRSYCPSPVCTPARVSMITGQYSTRHGAYTIGMSPSPALEGPTFGSILGNVGYATALIGKTHFVARKIEDQHVAGVRLDSPCPDTDFWENYDGPYCGFQYIRHHRHHNASDVPNAHYRTWLRRKGADLDLIDSLHGKGVRRPVYGRWDIDPDLTQNAWITDETIEWIDRLDKKAPWCAMVNYQDPHYPYVCPEPYFSAVDMTNVDIGGIVAEEMEGKPPFYKYFIEHKDWRDDPESPLWDGICIPNINAYEKIADPENAIRAYIGMCTMIDDYVGRLLQWLIDTQQFENTLIIFTSDHGDQLGQHGMWGKGPVAYDDNQRVPGFMQWLAAQPGSLGNVSSHFNHVDILPTVCDAAGADIPSGIQGISHIPVLRGETDCVRDWALVDHVASRNQTHPELETTDLHQTTFVWEEWKLVVYAHAEYGELYNLTKDPLQCRNRWNDLPERRCRMLHRLARAEMERSGTLPVRIGPC